jgi:hypothetical protein
LGLVESSIVVVIGLDANGLLVYLFGGECRAGWYRQGNSTGGVLHHMT